jgi:hypothetical protein
MTTVIQKNNLNQESHALYKLVEIICLLWILLKDKILLLLKKFPAQKNLLSVSVKNKKFRLLCIRFTLRH